MADAADIFDAEAERYDAWFETPEGRLLFENELAAIRLLWREEFRPALEVGVGTGRFAQALGIESGIDPAAGALRLAGRRGIKTKLARGEALPFSDASFGGVLMIATLCFAEDTEKLFREASRVLRSDGRLLIGDIPANSRWGEHYIALKAKGHPFYQHARFHTIEKLIGMLGNARLKAVAFSSTLTKSTPQAVERERPGAELVTDAGFVCLLAEKLPK